MQSSSSRLDAMNRLGRAMADPTRSRILMANLVEAAVSIVAGAAVSSAALIGFGLDSLVEVLSAAAVAWQFSRAEPEKYEKGTLRVIAFAFLRARRLCQRQRSALALRSGGATTQSARHRHHGGRRRHTRSLLG